MNDMSHFYRAVPIKPSINLPTNLNSFPHVIPNDSTPHIEYFSSCLNDDDETGEKEYSLPFA